MTRAKEKEAEGLRSDPAVTNAVKDIRKIFTRFEYTPEEEEIAQFAVVSAYVAGYVAGTGTNGIKEPLGFRDQIYARLARERAIEGIKRD